MESSENVTLHRFIASWGEMGSKWGISKAMGQIHALLMVSDNPLSTEDAMKELSISRGNANINLRGLVDWGLIRRVHVKGDRKEYFESEKDVWKMFCIISRERKRREIEPVIAVLTECLNTSVQDKQSKLFRDQIGKLLDFMKTADTILGKVAQHEQSKLLPRILNLLS